MLQMTYKGKMSYYIKLIVSDYLINWHGPAQQLNPRKPYLCEKEKGALTINGSCG